MFFEILCKSSYEKRKYFDWIPMENVVEYGNVGITRKWFYIMYPKNLSFSYKEYQKVAKYLEG